MKELKNIINSLKINFKRIELNKKKFLKTLKLAKENLNNFLIISEKYEEEIVEKKIIFYKDYIKEIKKKKIKSSFFNKKVRKVICPILNYDRGGKVKNIR